MPWAKLDENFHAHPKTYLVGLEGCGLFCKALSYCAHYLTDGFLPAEWVYAQVPATRRSRDTNGVVERLLAADLFREVEGGFMIDDYLDCNPSREQYEAQKADVSSKRRKAGRRGGLARAKQTASKPLANDVANEVAKSYPVPVPTTEANVVPQQQQVAPAAAAALHPAFADVMAIAQEAYGKDSTLQPPQDFAIERTLRAYPDANHLRAANLAASDLLSGRRTTRHFEKVLADQLADQAKAPTAVDRRSERERREADDLAAMERELNRVD